MSSPERPVGGRCVRLETMAGLIEPDPLLVAKP